MAQFSEFQNILPSPSFKIGDAGQNEADGGTKEGPGYASVKLSSVQKTLRSRTNSGRYTARSAAYHMWKVDISYNPMTRAEFMPVYTFLLEKQGGLKPFYVSLPQYEAPQDTTFTNVNSLSPIGSFIAGTTNFLVGSLGTGGPTPGDLFNIEDTSDSNHKKAYMITRVETNADYLTGSSQPLSNQARIHFTPPLAKEVDGATSDLIFKKGSDLSSPPADNPGPLIKVVTKDMQEYSLGTNNLYKFSLSLEEVQ